MLAGAFEVVSALFLGQVIDAALGSGRGQLLCRQRWSVCFGVAFFLLVLRPLSFGISAAFQALILTPNLNTLVLSRLHRWTLGQSVTFFDNDFAGRIAQKQMQTARALTDVVVEIINVGALRHRHRWLARCCC